MSGKDLPKQAMQDCTNWHVHIFGPGDSIQCPVFFDGVPDHFYPTPGEVTANMGVLASAMQCQTCLLKDLDYNPAADSTVMFRQRAAVGLITLKQPA